MPAKIYEAAAKIKVCSNKWHCGRHISIVTGLQSWCFILIYSSVIGFCVVCCISSLVYLQKHFLFLINLYKHFTLLKSAVMVNGCVSLLTKTLVYWLKEQFSYRSWRTSYYGLTKILGLGDPLFCESILSPMLLFFLLGIELFYFEKQFDIYFIYTVFIGVARIILVKFLIIILVVNRHSNMNVGTLIIFWSLLGPYQLIYFLIEWFAGL